MNALPVVVQKLENASDLERYFQDMEKWGFDIAYTACYGLTKEAVSEKYRQKYIDFASKAKDAGLPSCVQIQMTVYPKDALGVSEAQKNADNQPELWDELGYFASFASKPWLDYLKDLTTFFVEDCGFDWVVFEEPMSRVDIPGSEDPFYKYFTEKYPDVTYPDSDRESTEYLLVQEEKSRVVDEFIAELVSHAKSVGAKKVGCMPWFFQPTEENTPAETYNPSCDIAHISAIEGLDIIVVRMQPENVSRGTMKLAGETVVDPKLAYYEIIAHKLGKDVIAVNNPSDEGAPPAQRKLVHDDFFKDYLLAAMAACPSGFTRHWYGQHYGEDSKHMELLSEANRLTGRLAECKTPLALVFSYSGTRHSNPEKYSDVFKYFHTLASALAENAHMPFHIFYADTLAQDLKKYPEVQVLVFEEHFPLTTEQMQVISEWWKLDRKQGIVVFGSGLGYAAGTDTPSKRPTKMAFPGAFEYIGLSQEDEELVIEDEQGFDIEDVARVRRSAFIDDNVSHVDVGRIANVKRVFGSRANILYMANTKEGQVPLVAERRDQKTMGLYCGFGVSESTMDMAVNAVKYVLKEVDCPIYIVDQCSEGLLWNVTKQDYIVISNMSDKDGTAMGHPVRGNFWDCVEQKMLPAGDTQFTVPAKSYKVYRLIGRRGKLIDLIGSSRLRFMVDGVGRTEIEMFAGKKTEIIARSVPKDILVDGKHADFTSEEIAEGARILVTGCKPGERKLHIKW